jgi:DNA-binding NarL/FixJ family response regulator
MDQVSVILADDHALVRAGLRSLLERIEGVVVVAEAATGTQALAAAHEHRPQVVLMDISMPELDGLQATHEIRAQLPEVRVLVLSMHDDEESVLEALRAGARGYLLKDSAPMELELALRAVLSGQTYLSPPVSRQVVDGYLRRTNGTTSRADVLSPRQREILCMLANGRSVKNIAFDLGLSAKTVDTHRAQIMAKLDLHDLASLVKFAIREKLVSSA